MRVLKQKPKRHFLFAAPVIVPIFLIPIYTATPAGVAFFIAASIGEILAWGLLITAVLLFLDPANIVGGERWGIGW